LKRTPTITLDTDWLWRKALPSTATYLTQSNRFFMAMFAPLGRWVSSVVGFISSTVGVRSPLSTTWSLATMGLAVVILLIVQLVVVLR
jgi:hypothetical protein